ncbi:Putative ankyrin repeat protein [uncultured archaeon]|nr:Putative ankyrin repeat protein [uncultured archaeon]
MNKLDEILSAISRKDVMALKKLTPTDVNVRDQDGMTLLMNAILENADPSIVRLLIERGADINASDSIQKWTALHFAARDQNKQIVSILLEAGANVDPTDVFGNTPLWRSVMNSTSNIDVIKDLAAHGADPYRKNNYGNAPIDIARETGRADIVAIFESES